MMATPKADLLLIIGAGFARAMTIGFIGVVLAVMLFRTGLSPVQIGIVIGAGLVGAGSHPYLECDIPSGRRMACTENRASKHDGIHAHTVEPFPHGSAVRAVFSRRITSAAL